MQKKSSSGEYDEFLADLPETECRWAVYDLEFQNDEGGLRKKIVFLQWYVGWFLTDKKNIFVPMVLIKCTFLSLSFDFISILSLSPTLR